MTTSTYYVIRYLHSSTPAWISLASTPNEIEWSCRPADALRFVRREDAECVLSLVCHLWFGDLAATANPKTEFCVEPMGEAA